MKADTFQTPSFLKCKRVERSVERQVLNLYKKLLGKNPFKWLFLSSPLVIFLSRNGKLKKKSNNSVFLKNYAGIFNKITC